MLPQLKQSEVPDTRTHHRVFISYSRNDSALAEEFFDHLESRFRHTDSPYGPDQIFFDRRDIHAGDLWRSEILPALDSAEVVLLLVSVHCFKHRFCWEEEVPRAVTAGKRIILVLLSPCSWEGMPIGAGVQRTTLRELAAVPVLDLKGETILVPVTKGVSGRNRRAERWLACVDQIVTALKGKTRPEKTQQAPSPETSSFTKEGLDEHLPILCDQDSAREELEGSADRDAVQKALFVLIQGDGEDHPLEFWWRILNHELRGIKPWDSVQFLEARRNHRLRRVPARTWSKTVAGKSEPSQASADGAEVLKDETYQQVLSGLLTTLTQHTNAVPEESPSTAIGSDGHADYAVRLRMELGKQTKIQPIHCDISHMSPDDAIASIRALGLALSRLGETAPVRRLAFGFIWERAEDLRTDFASAFLGIPSSACHAVALPRLEAFGRTAVQIWWQSQRQLQSLSETKFLDQAFAGNRSKIRFRDLFTSYQSFINP